MVDSDIKEVLALCHKIARTLDASGTNVVPWYGDDKPLPAGAAWVTDGFGVWIVETSGAYLKEVDRAAVYWTPSVAPDPPSRESLT